MFIATIPAVLWVDSWGRKPTLIIGALGMAICHIIIVSFLPNARLNLLGQAPLITLLGYHHRKEPRRLGTPPIRRLGRRRHGLALRNSLWILMGALCLDRHCGDMATVESPVRHCPRRFVELVCPPRLLSISL